MYKRVSGTKDVLPQEALLLRRIEEISRDVFSLFNYREIRTPIIEDAALFNRSLGNSSEIVQKQMFLIQNKDEQYVLRPEGTASIVRAYLENNLDKTEGFSKFYYMGPMFRLERPQKGRLRQFNHIGVEAIGSTDAQLDVEVISLADRLLKAYGLEDYNIKINSLGCSKDKAKLNELLKVNLKPRLVKLCQDCKVRYEKNTLRILDCKNEGCREVIENLEFQKAGLCFDCSEHFSKVLAGLDSLGTKYEVAPYLVRGLDYYTRTVFEITSSKLGSQDALGAGGRYDNLVKELGGPDLGAMGFAFGVERLLLVAKPQSNKLTGEGFVYLVSLGEAAKKESLKILQQLRDAGIPCDTDFEGKSIKGAMRKANDLSARFVLIVGEDELKKGVLTLKDMETSSQKEIRLEELLKELKC